MSSSSSISSSRAFLKRLLAKGALLAALVLGPFVALFLLPLPYDHSLSSIINKVDLLKDGRRGRIIFVGGSGLFCGLDSELVQAKLKRPVVNVGLYIGFGITPLLREIKPYLREGDTIVVVPEYGIWFDRYDHQARKLLFALGPVKNFVSLYGFIPDRAFLSDFYGLAIAKFRALRVTLREAVLARRSGPVIGQGHKSYQKYFNANGDFLMEVHTPASPETIIGRGQKHFTDPGKACLNQPLKAFNEFCREARELGVEIGFVFPAYPEQEYRLQLADMRRYEQRLRKELNCPVLGKPEEFLYPYSLFADSIHHLNAEGKRKRTEALIALLETLPASSRLPQQQTADDNGDGKTSRAKTSVSLAGSPQRTHRKPLVNE
ncbi:MAG TPA: hypothetical protein VN604_05905 [Nitrospirota bacterium]|nr:hypothetical protein [Nitrospirota bacterium]